MINEKDLSDDFLGDEFVSFADPESLRYGINARVDLQTVKWLEEYANHHTNGNMSEVIRHCVYEKMIGFKASKESPVELRVVSSAFKRRMKKRVKETLKRSWLELQELPDSEQDEEMFELARKYNEPWPPPNVKASDVNPHLRDTLSRIRILCEENNGQTTLSELQRSLSRYKIEDVRKFVSTLEDEKMIVTKQGDTVRSLIITDLGFVAEERA